MLFLQWSTSWKLFLPEKMPSKSPSKCWFPLCRHSWSALTHYYITLTKLFMTNSSIWGLAHTPSDLIMFTSYNLVMLRWAYFWWKTEHMFGLMDFSGKLMENFLPWPLIVGWWDYLKAEIYLQCYWHKIYIDFPYHNILSFVIHLKLGCLSLVGKLFNASFPLLLLPSLVLATKTIRCKIHQSYLTSLYHHLNKSNIYFVQSCIIFLLHQVLNLLGWIWGERDSADHAILSS